MESGLQVKKEADYEEEDEDGVANNSDYRVKYTGLGNMLKRVQENRSSLEREIPLEKASKVVTSPVTSGTYYIRPNLNIYSIFLLKWCMMNVLDPEPH